MDGKTSYPSVTCPEEASNHEEVFMQQSLLFSDTLKELKNLSKQLYSAAEYFEVSYNGEEQKQLVVETFKDYAIKALINTVDHLGSVAYKVNNFLDEKIGQVSAAELRLSCIEQRLQACQEYINQGGLLQQSLLVETPRHHKRYIFPVEETMEAVHATKSKHHSRTLSVECSFHQFKNATVEGNPPSFFREQHSTLQSSPRQGTCTFTRPSINRKPEKTAASPQRFPLLRSVSLLKRSISPKYATPKQRYPTQPRRTVSSSTLADIERARFAERERARDAEQYSGKSKRLFKALLSMRKFRKDGSMYKYLDEF